MDSVRDEKCDEFVAGEQALDDIIVPVEFGRNPVAEMGAKLRARFDGCVNIRIRGIRVPERNLYPHADSMPDDIRAARQFRRQGQEPDQAAGSFLEPVEIGDVGQPHVSRVVGAAVAGKRREPRAFDMVAADGFADRGITGPDRFDAAEFGTKRTDFVGDEREEKPAGRMGGERTDRRPEIGGRQFGLLEIHPREPVDLDIEVAGGLSRIFGRCHSRFFAVCSRA